MSSIYDNHKLRCHTLITHWSTRAVDSRTSFIFTMASTSTNELCEACQSLFLRIGSSIGRLADFARYDSHASFSHHHTFKSLEESCKNGCGICTELMRSLKNTWASPCKLPERPEWERKLEPLSWLDWFEKFFPSTCRVDKFSASWQNSLELTFKSHNDGYIESQKYGYGFKVKGSGYGFNMRFILEVVEDSNGQWVLYY